MSRTLGILIVRVITQSEYRLKHRVLTDFEDEKPCPQNLTIFITSHVSTLLLGRCLVTETPIDGARLLR